MQAQDHAAYLAGWLRVLRADTRALVTVSSRAQAAVDFLVLCLWGLAVLGRKGIASKPTALIAYIAIHRSVSSEQLQDACRELWSDSAHP